MTSSNLYVLPELPYALDALEPVISARIMELHHGTHHRAYVDNANKLTAQLDDLDPDADPTALIRSLSFNISGHVLHSLFWKCMSPHGGGDPSPEVREHLSKSFGSIDKFKSRMTTALEKLSGSGWAALVWEPAARRLNVTQIHDHQHDQIAGAVPILVIDGWEHAYYLQYEADKAEWAGSFWDIVDWKGMQTRLNMVISQPSVQQAP